MNVYYRFSLPDRLDTHLINILKCHVCSGKQVAGKWYLIGFATNAEWFVTRKANMKMGVAMLTPNDGDLEMAYSSLK